MALVRCTWSWLLRPPLRSIDPVSLTTSASFEIQPPGTNPFAISSAYMKSSHSRRSRLLRNMLSMIYATAHDMYGILRNLPCPGLCLLDRQCTSESNSGGVARTQQPNCFLEMSHRPINMCTATEDAHLMPNVLARPRSLHIPAEQIVGSRKT